MLTLALAGWLYWAHESGLARSGSRPLSSANAHQPETKQTERTAKPQIIFWAWERPEDLRFLRGGQAGVAFLAKTIFLENSDRAATSGNGFTVRPRLQPLRTTPGTPLIAVVRIETSRNRAPAEGPPRVHAVGLESVPDTSAMRDELASEIAATQSVPSVAAVQIDFDAPLSERAFYSGLLREVRRKLRAGLQLSITALASWCIGDRWLEKLPAGTIDEAVPMLFRMGRDAAQVVVFMRRAEEFPVASCRSSLGLSTDEQLSRAVLDGTMFSPAMRIEGRRVYVFSPKAWTAEQAGIVLKELQP